MKNDGEAVVKDHKVVSHEEWLQARRAFLAKEKEFTRLRDQLSEQRRLLPWEPVTKEYVFDTPQGKRTLAKLFDGRSQLVVYHAMFHPKTATSTTPWTQDAACKTCSFWMDNIERMVVHLNHRDVTMIAISRGSLDKLEAYRKRMGWTFPWASTGENTFALDYRVSFTERDLEKAIDYNYTQQNIPLAELPGISVFYKDSQGRVFHTYSAYSRGLDMLNVGYHYLDIVPKGRDEGDGNGSSWLKRRDEYDRSA
jgi:predicted dithiol-disulfide oxidoreductase (DUF899 family)